MQNLGIAKYKRHQQLIDQAVQDYIKAVELEAGSEMSEEVTEAELSARSLDSEKLEYQI